MILFVHYTLINGSQSMISSPSAVIISHCFACADNDCLKLLIIDVWLLIKYNTLKNHIIVILVLYGWALTGILF